MKKCWTPLLLLGLIGAGPATGPVVDEKAVGELVQEFGKRVVSARYMEGGEGKVVSVPGWEGFETRRYTYSVKDKDGVVKSADVVLLDPTPVQIATWIVEAVTEVKGTYVKADGERYFKHVIGQSGGQFPVAGVVYEDILPADGKNETYCFRDGVTVEVEGVKHRGTDVLTKEEVEASVSGKVKRVFTYARIQSTSPAMWVANGGERDVMENGKSTMKWLEVVRGAYQKAWKSSRNELMVALVRGLEGEKK